MNRCLHTTSKNNCFSLQKACGSQKGKALPNDRLHTPQLHQSLLFIYTFQKKKKRRGNRGKKNHLISNSSFKNTTAAGPAPGTGVAAGPASRDPAVEGTAGRQTAVWMGRMSSRSL